MKYKMLIMVVGAVLAMAPAYGGYVTDDFESYSAVSEMTNKNWKMDGVVSLVADNAPGTAGSQAVEMLNTTIAAMPTLYQTAIDTTNKTSVSIEFDYKADNCLGSPNLRTLADGSVMTTQMQMGYSATDTHLYVYHGTGYATGPSLVLGDWYHFTVELFPDDTFEVGVTDSGSVDYTTGNLPFKGGTFLDTNKFYYRFSSGKLGGSYTLDNVNVSAVPEPATMGLFGLGGLATLLIRRFHI